MPPTIMCSSKGTRRSRSCPLAISINRSAWSISWPCASIGISSRTGPWADARRIARNCTRNITGSARQKRIARSPSAGFSGTATLGAGGRNSALSAPTSSVRIVTGPPCIATTAARYASNCSSSPGRSRRLRNRNSERNRPIPCAPAARATAASSGRSMFAHSCTACPSSVTAGTCSRRSSSSRSRRPASCLPRYSASTASSGATMTMPCSPSRISQSSSRTRRLAIPRPTTAGTFIPRARIAVCEVAPPRSIPKPTAACSDSISAGETSSAM